MKYILLLMFFTASDPEKNWSLQSTNALEFDSQKACEFAAQGVWCTFAKIDSTEPCPPQPNTAKTSKTATKPAAKPVRAVNMVAWCIPTGATKPEDVYRVPEVGKNN